MEMEERKKKKNRVYQKLHATRDITREEEESERQQDNQSSAYVSQTPRSLSGSR